MISLNKSESKYFNTALKMDKAFLEILENKNFEYITVKEICTKANVNRSTFYLHYENMNDLLLESIEYINKEFASYFNSQIDMENSSIDELYLISNKHLVPYLTFVKDNQRLFQTILKNNVILNGNITYQNMVKNIFRPIMEKMNFSNKEINYMITFYLNGIMAIINEWVRNGCNDSIDEIVTIIIKCVT